MRRFFTLCSIAVVVVTAGAPSVYAQAVASGPVHRVASPAVVSQGELHGVVLDDQGQPLAGAMVSAVGATRAFVVSKRDGTFVLRDLPAGPYLLRAHLLGYAPPRARIVQVNTNSSGVSTIVLTPRVAATGEPRVLEAGIGSDASGQVGAGDDTADDHGEVAWRLRHLKRSVLKDVDTAGVVEIDPDRERWLKSPIAAAANPGWLATLPLNGQVNLLTSTSFDRPRDLFTLDVGAPRGVTYIALTAPAGAGDWAARGAVTQGELSSWIVSGSYVRHAPASHQYEAGMSYGTQRDVPGNTYALATMSDGTRNVGEVYAFDRWTAGSHVQVSYGAKYARYDYLNERALLSPRVDITVKPHSDSSFAIHGTIARRELAPGAEEFLPPPTGLWVPPERTFSPLAGGTAFTPERMDHIEVSAEREWVGDFTIGLRAFRQQIDDQIVTVFGLGEMSRPATGSGHYDVASGGDIDAHGWGLTIARTVVNGTRASIDYTQTDANWVGASRDQVLLERAVPSTVRSDRERIYDLTAAVHSQLPGAATKLVVIYKINSAFAADDRSPDARPGARFDVQINQSLPFLNFYSAQWEMLVAVRNLFRDELTDASVYDELLVVRPPKRIVGGLIVRF